MAGKGDHQPKSLDGKKATQDKLCGLAMPISSNDLHSENYWSQVRTILHRVIDRSGMTALNVWEDSTIDRISERIIANIFKCEIVVVDISDLNPNVMLELGLRLASQKPTVCISGKSCPIPFDIRDLEVMRYPDDLNIIEMEFFMNQLEAKLTALIEAKDNNSYKPFLQGIVIETTVPGEREVTLGESIASKLDALTEFVLKAHQTEQLQKLNRRRAGSEDIYRTISKASQDGTTYFAEIPPEGYPNFVAYMDSLPIDDVKVLSSTVNKVFVSVSSKEKLDRKLNSLIEEIVIGLGGRTGVPDYISRMAK